MENLVWQCQFHSSEGHHIHAAEGRGINALLGLAKEAEEAREEGEKQEEGEAHGVHAVQEDVHVAQGLNLPR